MKRMNNKNADMNLIHNRSCYSINEERKKNMDLVSWR